MWTHPGHGAFQTGAHWAGGLPPGPAATAVFEQTSSSVVTFLADAQNTGFVARGAARPTLDLSGRAYALSGAASVVVGEHGGDGASLTLRGGELSGFNVEVGREGGAVGSLVVTGAAATLRAALDLFVARGEAASGTLSVNGGAEVTTRTAYFGFEDQCVGAGEVRGSGSSLTCAQDLVIGQFGAGILDVSAGGIVSAQNIASGRSSASSGWLRVMGEESELFTLFKLSMGSGFGASALFEVSDGARARSLFGVLAEMQSSGGDALITGAGSRWDVDDALYVGFRGDGFLRIADGARVDSKFSVIGRYANATGAALVEGPGALWVNEGQIEVAAAGAGPCSLVVETGATVRSAHLVIGSAGELVGDGVVESAVRVAGVHRPGPRSGPAGAIGASAVVGAYALEPSGTLELDVAGLRPAQQHDVLVVVGDATLGGTLRLLCDPSFDPAMGSTLTVLHASELGGWFAAIEAPELRWPKRLIVEQEGQAVVIRVGLRRLSEVDSLLPESDDAVRAEDREAGAGRFAALRTVREWVWAALESRKSAGGFQP